MVFGYFHPRLSVPYQNFTPSAKKPWIFSPFEQFLLTILLCGRKTNILDMKHLVSLKLEFTQETHVSMTRVPRGGEYDVDKKINVETRVRIKIHMEFETQFLKGN